MYISGPGTFYYYCLFVLTEMNTQTVKTQFLYLRRIEYHIFGVFIQQKVLISVGFLTYFFEVTNFTVLLPNIFLAEKGRRTYRCIA